MKISELPLLALNFIKFLMLFLEPTVSFSWSFTSLLSVMRHNSSVLFHPISLYALDNRSLSKCKFPHFRLLAWKLTKYLMSFYKPRVSFTLNFASPFSVMTHNSSETFWLKHMILTKRAHQCTICQTFECFNESSPNSSCHFWNHKVRVYSNVASLFPLHFLAQTVYTLDKNSPLKWNVTALN